MKSSFPIAAFTFILSTCYLSTAIAGDSIDAANAASGHASAAVNMGIVAVGQATIGVLAVPMLSIGASGSGLGATSTRVGQVSAAAAGSPANGPLPLTDKTITVTSPTEALKPSNTTPR